MRNDLNKTIKERINSNIKYLIDKKGISQSTLSKEIDKSVTHINALINGHGTPTLQLIIDICKYLDVKIDDLIYKNMSE